MEIKDHVPSLHNVIVCDEVAALPAGIRSFEGVVGIGREKEKQTGGARFDDCLASAKPDDLATLGYTSGTTGNPKGAMLTHGNIASNAQASLGVMPIDEGAVALSILPLSHILERVADYAYFMKGATIAYAENDNKVSDNLQAIQPHAFEA